MAVVCDGLITVISKWEKFRAVCGQDGCNRSIEVKTGDGESCTGTLKRRGWKYYPKQRWVCKVCTGKIERPKRRERERKRKAKNKMRRKVILLRIDGLTWEEIARRCGQRVSLVRCQYERYHPSYRSACGDIFTVEERARVNKHFAKECRKWECKEEVKAAGRRATGACDSYTCDVKQRQDEPNRLGAYLYDGRVFCEKCLCDSRIRYEFRGHDYNLAGVEGYAAGLQEQESGINPYRRRSACCTRRPDPDDEEMWEIGRQMAIKEKEKIDEDVRDLMDLHDNTIWQIVEKARPLTMMEKELMVEEDNG